MQSAPCCRPDHDVSHQWKRGQPLESVLNKIGWLSSSQIPSPHSLGCSKAMAVLVHIDAIPLFPNPLILCTKRDYTSAKEYTSAEKSILAIR